MSRYIDADLLIEFLANVRMRLPKESKDFFTRDEMLLNFAQYVNLMATEEVQKENSLCVRIAFDRNELQEIADKCVKNIEIDINLAKSDAVKEFVERLKNKIKTECNPYGKPTFDYDTSISIMRYIDNLVKEMVGDSNA